MTGTYSIEVGELGIGRVFAHMSIRFVNDDDGSAIVEINGEATDRSGARQPAGAAALGYTIDGYLDGYTSGRPRYISDQIPNMRSIDQIGESRDGSTLQNDLAVVYGVIEAINSTDTPYAVGNRNSNTVATHVLQALGFTVAEIRNATDRYTPGTNREILSDEQISQIVDVFGQAEYDSIKDEIVGIEFDANDGHMIVTTSNLGQWQNGEWDSNGDGVINNQDDDWGITDPPRPRPDNLVNNQGPSESDDTGVTSSPRPQGRPTSDTASDSAGSAKPIIIDLDHDGIELAVNGDVSFDYDGDGYFESGNWAHYDDGFLVLDLNTDGTRGAGDGEIDQTRELVLSAWGNEGDTDLQALRRAFDENNDGILSDHDAVWSELRVWQDLNQDGVSDSDELRTLADWGITQINLGYDNGFDYGHTTDDISILGNTLLGTASYTQNGEVIEGGVGDVALSYATHGWRRVDTVDGYYIELENAGILNYKLMDGSGSADTDLATSILNGVSGDDRNNLLNATAATVAVSIAGGAGNDSVWGGALDDLLSGDTGADDIRGGAGNDQLFVDADDLTSGNVSGGSDNDTLIVTGDVGVNVTLLAHEVEAAYGSEGNDNFSGVGLTDDLPISGGGGNDTITGGSGNDYLSGDAGNDSLQGGNGSDVLIGGVGLDTLKGGTGDDQLWGNEADDFIFGDDGADILYGGEGNDALNGGGGADTLDGGAGDDWLNGGWGWDELIGGNGADKFFHHGVATGFGTEWVRDFSDTEGDRLVTQANGTAGSFVVTFATTQGRGSDSDAEAFVRYTPTGQVAWILQDGANLSELMVQTADGLFDLLA